jgi:hypothetical protein
VNGVRYLYVIFDERMTWMLHTETTEANAFRTFITLYFLFGGERLSVNIELTLHKAVIGSVMAYACLAWEFAAEAYLLKLQCLQGRFLRTIGGLPGCKLVSDMHVVFQVSYVYDCITKLCRRQAEVIHNHEKENENVRNIGQEKPHKENIKCLKLAAVIYKTVQVFNSCGMFELIITSTA